MPYTLLCLIAHCHSLRGKPGAASESGTNSQSLKGVLDQHCRAEVQSSTVRAEWVW